MSELPSHLHPRTVTRVVAWMREWIPVEAQEAYRRLMREDPAGWHLHPHFAGGLIPRFVLRGNGITEQVLGVRDLEEVWPALLRLAVEQGEPGEAGEPEGRAGLRGSRAGSGAQEDGEGWAEDCDRGRD